jgi:hypothetical protein
MADGDYFVKEWKVLQSKGAFNGQLPARGSIVKIELRQNGRSKTYRMVTRSKKVFDGFKLKGGQLELQIDNPDRVLVLVPDTPSKGRDRIIAQLKPRPLRARLPAETIQGTWGAESGGGGG